MIIVDNLVHSFGLQLSNGIPIVTWKNDKKDCELKYLTDYLIEAAFVDDTRRYIQRKFFMEEMINFID